MNYARTMMLLAALTALFLGVGWLLGGSGGMAIAFLFALATNAFAWWNSDKLALRMHGAEPVTRMGDPALYDMVERLAQRAGLPTPALYVIRSDQPNAFATGRSPDNAAVAVTTGIMRALSTEELAGVIAHELAHIRNRDTLIMTIAATVGGAISMIAQIAQFGMLFGGRDGEGRSPLGPLGVLVAVIFAPLAAMVIQMTISRTREYAADRAAAEITQEPLWLASALRKIAAFSGRIVMESAERNPASAHLFIVNPLAGRRFDSLFATHPAAENRIAALEALAAEMGRGGGSSPAPRTGAVPRVPRAGRAGAWR